MKVVATLSDQGWLSDPVSMLDRIMSYYILTDAAQSTLFKGKLKNLPETYYKYINLPNEMASAVSRDLEYLLGRSFDRVVVETVAKKITEAEYAILLYVEVYDDVQGHAELTKVVRYSPEAKLIKVINVNNKGDGAQLLTELTS